ncbi:MAG: MipA family protein [Sphingomonadales bacterium]|jgi:outer membrane protein|nr:MipA family protein [Sphingomonadales bacterium]
MTPSRRTSARLAALAGAALLSLAAAPASAQDDQVPRGRIVTLGMGAQVSPQYPGADSYAIGPFPNFGLRRPGEPIAFESADDGAGFGFLGYDSVIDFGPAVRFQSKRDEDDVGAPVGNVGFTVEVGGFVDIKPSQNFRIRAELRRGLGGHRAWVGSLGADLILRDDQNYFVSIGPRLRWGDNRYHDAYYGLPFSIPAVGLPAAYNPRGGISAVGAIANLNHRLGRNWGLQAYAGYDRLVRDAADSPIVRVFGSRDQFSGGAGLWIEFNVGGGRR